MYVDLCKTNMNNCTAIWSVCLLLTLYRFGKDFMRAFLSFVLDHHNLRLDMT